MFEDNECTKKKEKSRQLTFNKAYEEYLCEPYSTADLKDE